MNEEMDDGMMQKKPKFWPIYVLLLIISLVTSVFAIYELSLLSSIEDMIRYIVMGLLALTDLFLILRIRRILHPKKKKVKKIKKYRGILIFMVFYSLICGIVGMGIQYVYKEISGLNKEYITYTSKLIVPRDSKVEKPNEMFDMKIAILEDEESIEGYKIPMDMVKEQKLEDENELVSYGDFTSMVVDLYAGDVDACFVPGGYVELFDTMAEYANIESDTKVILSKSEKLKKAETSKIEVASSGKDVREPFTILLMGIDSTDEVLSKNAVANGDTLILITFNPKTLNATMLSIPRDSYVPIACWSDKAENKITHAAAYGNDCMIQTIQNYFDVNIDYYAKINFKGLVKLVNALGGVEIDVEKELCTDDSNRMQEICVQPGKQILDGEHALVYARNRKQLADGDFGRNYHQQVIIKAMMDKIKDIDDVGTFMNILNTISNSMDTNFTTKQILSFYNIAKDIMRKSLSTDKADLVNIERLYLQGSGQMIYDERAKMTLWDYVPNKNSRKDIIQAMKENLELADHQDIKEFHFSINDPYEKEVIGYGPYTNTGNYSLIPDFTGDTQAQASATCLKYNIRCTFNGTGGTVINQSFPAGKRVDKLSGNLVLTLSQSETTKDKKKPVVEENEEEEEEEEETTSNKEETTLPETSEKQVETNEETDTE
ncbi:MAG: LCP family protein [Bacilli bacterium]|nr:LCP family protein [Bacilli bacterium]